MISSYIFMDLETTGFPWQENNQTRMTELAMVAVRRDQLFNAQGTGLGQVPLPRVLNKLVMCFRPDRPINSRVCEITGLDNQNLDKESPFDSSCFESISKFIDCQKKPVCFVTHNGNGFDYPILRAEIDKIKANLPDDVLCIDSLPMFREIMKNYKDVEKKTPDDYFNDDFISEDDLAMIASIEKSYSSDMENTFDDSVTLCKASPFIPADNSNVKVINKEKIIDEKKPSYKLGEIYLRLFGTEALNTHRAEDDCIILLQICMARVIDFFDWSEKNFMKFNDIPKMEVGKKFGLLYKK